jgi:glycerophosphoryl diester phosphodiesterase
LVEIGLFGVSHNAGVYVTCAECLSISDGFAKEHPDIIKDLEEWAGRKIEIVPEKKSEKNSEPT